MSEHEELSLLRNFFAAYFHEDWRCNADTTEAVVDDYARGGTPEELRLVANAIRSYAARFSNDRDLEKGLDKDLGCYYVPSGTGLSAKAWMEGIANRFSQDIPN
ncbi:hypothetical protein FTW19_08300 [Terriglobus albidus]|uniref:CdiI immunity protein domain-containing protein n=1 Tax=Terriglobus albidus TaxID=1592106 RepID=A0A5B9EA46_9BACT|nr:contact-dependent growth inhibition system immunity protein [Terriglobus albidus]QEE27995.1 hypothetical protein FTW19_08300 [Terriglobus albidus]